MANSTEIVHYRIYVMLRICIIICISKNIQKQVFCEILVSTHWNLGWKKVSQMNKKVMQNEKSDYEKLSPKLIILKWTDMLLINMNKTDVVKIHRMHKMTI